MMFRTIVITKPTFFDGEADMIVWLLRQGKADILHVRKPSASEKEYEDLLKLIPSIWHSSLVIHDHFELTQHFTLGGVHLNSRHPEAPVDYQGSISRSCHSLEEIIIHRDRCDYLFLSPIFDSISKEGYGRNFTITQLQEAAANGIITPQVIALGGIGRETLPLLRPLPFGGCAFLGAIWGQNLSSAEVFVNFAYYLKEMATWQ